MTSLAAETKAFDMTEEELADGFSAQGLFCGEHSRQMYGATFDDLIILPGSIDVRGARTEGVLSAVKGSSVWEGVCVCVCVWTVIAK